MKLSKKFLNDYIDIEKPFKEVAEDMTRIGNEYDKVSPLVDSTPLVIGEILEVENHPDSDHLHVCKVNIGSEILQIVCGAPNVRKGLKVIVAVAGTVLPGGTINKSTIRGVESNGMMCAISELGIEHKFLSKEDMDGIHEMDENAPVGGNAIEYMKLDDEVIDFELTPNRGDLLSILGFAYECASIYDKKIKNIDLTHKEINDDINKNFNINVKTDKCFTFLAKKVLNVEIKESPLEIKNRLIASGIRPINNIVDISNYVMLETGQPLHFYDADKVNTSIGVRLATLDEELQTLDNKTRKLINTDLVIVNDKDTPIGLAGVMGGLDTEITENTKNILIESAIFDPISVRLTSKRVLRSEASNRFEKGLDVNRCYMAIERSCNLLEKYAKGETMKGMCEYNTLPREDKKIDITVSFINQILGFNIKKEEIIDVFNKLGFKVEDKEDNLIVSVPTRRIDISIKEDLIEEVGRIYGIDRIVGKLPITNSHPGYVDKYNRDIKHKLVALGLNETLTYTLVNEKESKEFTNEEFESIKILDPMTEERKYLRYSLLPSLVSVYEYNKARNNKDISIFEIGKSFKKINDEYKESYKLSVLMSGNYITDLKGNKNVDFYVIKGILEELLDYLGYINRYSLISNAGIKELHPYQSALINLNGKKVGFIGKLHPSFIKDDIYVFELEIDTLKEMKAGKVKYKEIGKFPSVNKDVTFIIDKNISSDDINNVIKKSSSNILKHSNVYDLYENGMSNEKAITFRLTFESSERTLTDEEVLAEFNKIIDAVCKKYNVNIKNM